MIYTVTFNPSLDYIVSVDDFKLGLTNRTSSELILPGGKGTNVSTVLKNLGFESTALGFVAGFTGNEIVKRLNDTELNLILFLLKMESQELILNLNLLTEQRLTEQDLT